MDVCLVTTKDTVYAPLYVAGILRRLSESRDVSVRRVIAVQALRSGTFRKHLKQRMRAYGILAFVPFAAIVVKTRLLARLENYIAFKRPYSLRAACEEYETHYIEVRGVNSSDFRTAVRDCDVMLSIAVGERFSAESLQAVPNALNVHSSILPRHAGLMGLFWTILSGDESAGVTVHRMAEDFDAGEILRQDQFVYDDLNSLHQLYLRATDVGSGAVAECLSELASGDAQAREQDPEERTYNSFPKKQDRRAFRRRGFRLFTWADVFRA